MTTPTQEEKFVVINTKRLQISSLVAFMLAEHNAFFCGTGFVGEDGYVGFKQATTLYNKRNRLDDSAIGIVIDTVKIAYNKRDRKIVCPDHMVKFTPDYKEFMQVREPNKSLFTILKSHQLV
ncbi:HNH endonuclease [Yersinia phage vB_YenM_P778]